LFGHVHTFQTFERTGTTYVNTSALDRLLPVALQSDQSVLAQVNAGNYAVIELDRDGGISVQCRLLRRNYAGWRVLGGPGKSVRTGTSNLIPEDQVFAD
jgi:hypothetical protein